MGDSSNEHSIAKLPASASTAPPVSAPALSDNAINLQQLLAETLEMRREDPWVRGLPMHVLIAHQLQTLATCAKTPPYQLLLVGRTLLDYMQEARRVPVTVLEQVREKDTLVSVEADDRDLAAIPQMMRIFGNLFQRVLSTEFDPDDADRLNSFYNLVWSSHVEGKIDFSKSVVIHLLLEKFPKYLEDSLIEAIKKWKPGNLVPLCTSHSHSFQILFSFLCQIFDHCNHHSRVMDFTTEFLKRVELAVLEKSLAFPTSNQLPVDLEQSRKRYEELIEMYSIPFHPVLTFISEVKLNGMFDTRVSFENSIIQDELLDLINDLIVRHPADKRLVTFFLASNEVTSRVINSTNRIGAITLARYPALWKILHKTE